MTTPWIPSVTVTEARGAVAPPANIDQAAVVLGCTSSGSVGLSPLFNSATAAAAALGYGDTIDAASYITDPIDPSRQLPGPVAIYKCASANPGTYGTVDQTGVLGAGTIDVDGTSLPFGTYPEAWLQVGVGFTTGMAGGTVRWTLDGGENWSGYTPIGTDDNFVVPNSGVKWLFTSALDAGDIAKVATVGPTPSTADIDTAATALARSSYDFSQIFFAFPMDAAMAAHVTLLLNTLLARGKRVEATIYTRGPDDGESEIDWYADIAADFAAFFDDRIEKKEGMPLLLTDPVTARVYLRPWAPAYFARMLSQPRGTWAGSPNDGALDGVQLYTSGDVLRGHDETGDVVTGLGDAFGQGNRFGCVFRGDTPQTRLGVYTTAPWTAWNPNNDHHIYLSMVRRIVNAAERSAKSVSFSDLGGRVFYDTDPITKVTTLQPDAQEAIHGSLFDVLTIDMRDDLENAQDANAVTGVVAVSSVITVNGQLATIPITLNLKVGAWIIKIALTVSVQ